ncbi:histidine phosphatase family protein [Trueperella bialowiezensis]|uniref:Phosphoglyceromutase n=1 Tax=Trueperella bialowiezensis TaxID=312285 RepID=A0A3S4VUL5_9ACTO|nr:histidine phosphatase family protein [Trueperella bialowiezensis]VEI14056.1 Phosphoglyceromutase [Trueperella bialowiezensis]
MADRLRLVFWRHGQTDQNLALRIQGSSDFPLNETGHAEARAAATELARIEPTRIYSSPLTRAMQTAQYLADETGLRVVADQRLSERAYGLWEGMTSDEIRDGYPDEWAQWRAGREVESVGLETRQATGQRVYDAVLDAVADVGVDAGVDAGARAGARAGAGADSGETIVFVAHGGSIANGIMTLLGQNPSEWVGLHGMDNCRWAIVEPREGGTPPWQLRSYNRRTVVPPNISR